MDRCKAVRTIRGREPGPDTEVKCQLWEGHGGPHWSTITPEQGTPTVWHKKGTKQSGKAMVNTAIGVTVLIVMLVALTAMAW